MNTGATPPNVDREVPRLEKRFAQDPSMVFRRIADEVESLYTLNEVSAHVWELLDGVRRVDEIRDLIVTEFDVSHEQAQEDLLQLIEQFEEIGAITEAPTTDG